MRRGGMFISISTIAQYKYFCCHSSLRPRDTPDHNRVIFHVPIDTLYRRIIYKQVTR